MRKLILGFIVVISLLFAQPNGIKGTELVNPEIVRLHIIANSNNEEDQKLKLLVRDAVLETLRVQELQGFDETNRYLEDNLDNIKKICQSSLEFPGYQFDVSLTTAYFPAKVYGQEAYPAGYYKALKIIIQEGQGENWWCVLYPPLCHEIWIKEQEEQVLQVNGETVVPTINSKEKRQIETDTSIGLTGLINTYLQVIKKICT